MHFFLTRENREREGGEYRFVDSLEVLAGSCGCPLEAVVAGGVGKEGGGEEGQDEAHEPQDEGAGKGGWLEADCRQHLHHDDRQVARQQEHQRSLQVLTQTTSLVQQQQQKHINYFKVKVIEN